jgi:phosphoribosylanthranilate isomerase
MDGTEKGNATAAETASPRVKICGITAAADAVECAALGVHAIGLVFFPKSPRHLTDNQARDISLTVAKSVCTVGVFVNETYDQIMQRVEHCRLAAVQLHGQESSDLVNRLRRENLMVIKALFAEGRPSFADVAHYNAAAFLLECGGGKLPGGNARKWNWELAKDMGKQYPLIIAGGLSPDNVSHAIGVARPHAVDVSSGVEYRPGKKDLAKVAAFIREANRIKFKRSFKNIF